MILNEWTRLPSWMGIVVTCRPERRGVLLSPLPALAPLRLEGHSADNREDVFQFLNCTLAGLPSADLVHAGGWAMPLDSGHAHLNAGPGKRRPAPTRSNLIFPSRSQERSRFLSQ